MKGVGVERPLKIGAFNEHIMNTFYCRAEVFKPKEYMVFLCGAALCAVSK